jgi:hypothetical protein
MPYAQSQGAGERRRVGMAWCYLRVLLTFAPRDRTRGVLITGIMEIGSVILRVDPYSGLAPILAF